MHFRLQASITLPWPKAWERLLRTELFLRKEPVRGDYRILLPYPDSPGISYTRMSLAYFKKKDKTPEECVKQVKIIRARCLLWPNSNRVWSRGSTEVRRKCGHHSLLGRYAVLSQTCWAFLPPPYTSHLSLVRKYIWTLLSWKCKQACDRIPRAPVSDVSSTWQKLVSLHILTLQTSPASASVEVTSTLLLRCGSLGGKKNERGKNNSIKVQT